MRAQTLYLLAFVQPCDGDDDLIAMFRGHLPVSDGEAEMILGALSVLRTTGQIALSIPGLRLFNLDGVAVVVAKPDGFVGLGVVPMGQEPLTFEQVETCGPALQ